MSMQSPLGTKEDISDKWLLVVEVGVGTCAGIACRKNLMLY